MVAYSFKKQFSPRIVAGTKIGTIRAHRKRHAREGEALQLYQGMRTKHCAKIIPDPVCICIVNVGIMVGRDCITNILIGDGLDFAVDPGHHDYFARLDGFDNASDMSTFWRQEHSVGTFEGVWVRWAEIPVPLLVRALT
tara:strand:- start:6047 stop:6463 length:417 start_codon:yes stop_codon:yes gene_type:complete